MGRAETRGEAGGLAGAPERRRSWGWLALAIYAPLGVAALTAIGTHEGREVLVARLTGERPALGAALGAALGLAVAALLAALARSSARARRMEDAFREILAPLGRHECLALALCSATAEEALFRAWLQPLVGLVPAALAFGLLHIPWRRELAPWPLFAAAMGLALGALYRLEGALPAPVAMHFAINLVQLHRLGRPPVELLSPAEEERRTPAQGPGGE